MKSSSLVIAIIVSFIEVVGMDTEVQGGGRDRCGRWSEFDVGLR
jgi:hypothetical protein